MLTLLFAEDIQREARCLMQHPRYWQRDGYGGGERSPIAQAHRLYVYEHEVDVYEVSLQTKHSDKTERAVHPLGRAAEDAVHHQYGAHRERYVEHSLNEEWEVSVAHLLKI